MKKVSLVLKYRDLTMKINLFSLLQRTDSKSTILFYFQLQVVTSKQEYFYSGLSLLAEIGGYLGLLLGVSFLNLASWAAELIQSMLKYSTLRIGQ